MKRVALVIDERLAALAGLMVGEDNVFPIPLNKLLGAARQGFPAPGELRAMMKGLTARSVINLNYHPAAAALGECIPADRRLGARWRDVAMGVPSDPQTAELFQATRGGRFGRRHLTDIWLDYAGEIDRSALPDLTLPDELRRRANGMLEQIGINSDKPYLIIIPGSGLPARNWGADNWREVVRELSTTYQVALVGTADDTTMADYISAGTNAVSLCGKTQLDTLCGVLAGAELVVGVDTGALQVAAMVGARCLGIYFGSMNYRETGPYGNGNLAVIPDDPAYPCQEWELERNPGYWQRSITPGAVLKAARWVLGYDSINGDGDVFQLSEVTADGLQWKQLQVPSAKYQAISVLSGLADRPWRSV